MRHFKQSALIIIFAILSMATLSAQIGQYKIDYNTATQTYTVYGKVNTSYAVPLSRFVNIFVTVMAPHGTAATRFVPTNIQTAAALSSSNVVTMSRLDGPSYNATKDYLFFNFDVGSANYTPQPIAANVEFPIFSFQSQNGCLGNLNVVAHGDADYTLAQNKAINASNAFSILGAGGDTYTSNYGTASVSCAVTPATITTAISPSPMTAGTPATLSITATNSAGNPAQSGMGYTYTVPTGLTIPAGSTPTNSCGGTATVTGNTVTFSGGTMASGMATCVITVPVVAATAGTIDLTTGGITNPSNVIPGANNGAGPTPTPIVINPATCAANAGTLGY